MRRLLLLPILAGCPYEARENPFAEGPPNVMSGSVTITDQPLASTVVVFLAAADDPMPPLGTGSPVGFTTVPASDFTSGTDGVRSAPFALTQVPDGDWLLTALMDADRNFHPSVPTLAGATCRDLIGAHLASLSGVAPGTVTVQGGELVSDISVVLARTLPFPRPTFTVSQDRISLSSPLPTFQLASVPIDATYGPDLSLEVTGPFDDTDVDFCDSAFRVHVVDEDDDGLPDPHPDYADLPPESRPPNVWPRVYLEWLGEPMDTDGDGIDDTFDRGDDPARYVTEGLPYTPQLLSGDPDVLASIGDISHETILDVAFGGAARRLGPDGTEELITDPTQLPPGAWSVTVIAESGQTWTVPNELDTALVLSGALPPPGVTSERDESQGRTVGFGP